MWIQIMIKSKSFRLWVLPMPYAKFPPNLCTTVLSYVGKIPTYKLVKIDNLFSFDGRGNYCLSIVTRCTILFLYNHYNWHKIKEGNVLK